MTTATHADAHPENPAITAPLTGAPACPQCGGKMWDNRASKRNPKAPDFKCRARTCDGVLWPGQHHAAVPILSPTRSETGAAAAADEGEMATSSAGSSALPPLRRCYLDLTEFVLHEVRPKYEDAGIPCTDAIVAAIVATLFIATCKGDGV